MPSGGLLDRAIGSRLSQLGVAFERAEVDGIVIYSALSRHVHPEELKLADVNEDLEGNL